MVPLGEIVADLEAGVSVNGLDEPVGNDSEVGVLKVSCVSQGRFLPEQNKKVVPTELTRVAVSPRAGDIVISRANTLQLVGASGYVTSDHPNLFLSDKLWKVRLRAQHENAARWLIAVLNSQKLRRELLRRATGTSGSMKNIGKDSFLGIRVPQPPREVQDALGEAFKLFEETGLALECLVSVKRLFKRGLMQRLLTGQKRFPEFRGAKWDEVHLGDLFLDRNEASRPDLPLLSVTGGRGLIPRNELDRRDTSNPDKSKYKRVAIGDIAYNTMRMWQGVSALASLEGIVSPAYTVAIPTNGISGRFAKHLFKYPPVINLFHRHSQGLVDDTLNLKFDRFAKIKLDIPNDVSEQNRIADVLDLADAEIELLSALEEQFEAYKRGLLSRLLSGELKVTA